MAGAEPKAISMFDAIQSASDICDAKHEEMDHSVVGNTDNMRKDRFKLEAICKMFQLFEVAELKNDATRFNASCTKLASLHRHRDLEFLSFRDQVGTNMINNCHFESFSNQCVGDETFAEIAK